METAKQPHWDKQEGVPIILARPDSPNRTPSFTEPLQVGQRATGTVGGVEIVVSLTNILTATKAHGEIINITDGQNDRDSLGDLSIGDTVLIRRGDMYSLEVDVAP
jgi:hypothetical protein